VIFGPDLLFGGFGGEFIRGLLAAVGLVAFAVEFATAAIVVEKIVLFVEKFVTLTANDVARFRISTKKIV
jgi:hypothetical protein